jgi:hypothetical protein
VPFLSFRAIFLSPRAPLFLSPQAPFFVTPSPLLLSPLSLFFCFPEPLSCPPEPFFFVASSPFFCHPEPSSEGSPIVKEEISRYARKDRVMRGRRPERSEGCTACARQDRVGWSHRAQARGLIKAHLGASGRYSPFKKLVLT